jgi:hypothetical protein
MVRNTKITITHQIVTPQQHARLETTLTDSSRVGHPVWLAAVRKGTKQTVFAWAVEAVDEEYMQAVLVRQQLRQAAQQRAKASRNLRITQQEGRMLQGRCTGKQPDDREVELEGDQCHSIVPIFDVACLAVPTTLHRLA